MNNLNRRQAGVLLHPTSLPGPSLCGDLGENAYWFVDFLQQSAVQVWQTLPLGACTKHNSPYECLSTYAGNEALISLNTLSEQGYLSHEVLRGWQARGGGVKERQQLLTQARLNFEKHPTQEDAEAFKRFLTQQQHWLDEYVVFRALRTAHSHQVWWQWPAVYRKHDATALSLIKSLYAQEIAQYRLSNFVFINNGLH